MDSLCVACEEVIADEEEWFRVRDEYVHRSCYEKYWKRVLARKEAEAPKGTPKNSDGVSR
jgi:hypothetical protein